MGLGVENCMEEHVLGGGETGKEASDFGIPSVMKTSVEGHTYNKKGSLDFLCKSFAYVFVVLI